MKNIAKVIGVFLILLGVNQKSFSHCEIPCGIYHDELRIELLNEHIQTIEKSMMQIAELQKADVVDYNQLVRWVDNKEAHADKIQEIVYQYFMNQRVKPVDPSEGEKYKKYVKQITLLHELLVYSMKAKQSIDIGVVKKLNETLSAFEVAYFEGKDHKHEVGDKKVGDGHKH
jgi:nickel superoxide dismutase